MEFRQTTVLGLFDSSQKHFIIPVYQRAYSWDKDQWKVFMTDLKEQIRGGNNYFYGNILLETIKKDIQYEVIDGQQRLTTLIIFLRALLDILKERKKLEAIDISFEATEMIYFKNAGNVKLRTVEYDRACFEALIIEGNESFETATPSQDRIKKGKKYFANELEKLKTDNLISILEKVEATELTCIELKGKKNSALMFELQNNRGKDLTNMEKIKSYFLYQMYVYSSEGETESNIESVSNIFKLIYLIINDLKLEEDSVLIYHCNAWLEHKAYNYRSIDDIKEVFFRSEDKVKWIKEFVNELHATFSNIKKMENSKLPYLEDLRKLSIPAFTYPFIIKGYKFFKEEKDLNSLYNILEIIVFRYKLIGSRADFTSRLNNILILFFGDLDDLRNDFRKTLDEDWYWSDSRVKQYLSGDLYKNGNINYILWKYEDSIQNDGYLTGSSKILNEQIEHISPQSPTNGEPIATGYEVNEKSEYSEEFINSKLNCIGNLMLISGTHNRSIGNKPFSEKIISYKSNPLLRQQSEIESFLDGKHVKWGIQEIEKRQKKILDYALAKWMFNMHKYIEIEI